jgi:hypothetical protein
MSISLTPRGGHPERSEGSARPRSSGERYSDSENSLALFAQSRFSNPERLTAKKNRRDLWVAPAFSHPARMPSAGV